MISFVITSSIGSVNQIRPLYMLCMMYFNCPTVRHKTTIVQQSWLSWNRMCPVCIVAIVSTNVPVYKLNASMGANCAYSNKSWSFVLFLIISTNLNFLNINFFEKATPCYDEFIYILYINATPYYSLLHTVLWLIYIHSLYKYYAVLFLILSPKN